MVSACVCVIWGAGQYKPPKKKAYTINMKPMKRTLFLLAFLASSPVYATEIYRWVDENGVANFSSTAPHGAVDGLSTMELEDSTPPDYDPEEDRYGVQAQAERMAALREDMANKREDARERQNRTSRQQPVQYRDPYRYGYPLLGSPPYYPRPPVRPEPPISVPYETVTFRPPGASRN
jgi:hypothetical protein